MVYQEVIEISTDTHGCMTDITDRVNSVISASDIEVGTAHVFNLGSTGIITTIEYEPGLEKDFPRMLDQLIPASRNYGHENAWRDGNAHSHLQASLTGPALTVPVSKGAALLGTWQQIVHVEGDIKPRRRSVVVTIHGESC